MLCATNENGEKENAAVAISFLDRRLDESGWGVVFEIPDTPSDWQQLYDETDT
jgi:hypothetical protein